MMFVSMRLSVFEFYTLIYLASFPILDKLPRKKVPLCKNDFIEFSEKFIVIPSKSYLRLYIIRDISGKRKKLFIFVREKILKF